MTETETRPISRAAVLAIVVVLAAMSAFYLYTSHFPAAAGQSKPMANAPGPPRDSGGPEEDGHVRGSVSVFDDHVAAVTRLDPDLLRALRKAAKQAADEGVDFEVNSGWRSAKYQDQLLSEAVSRYGSEAEAARWVATPETSPHVSGDAVDLGKVDATAWLSVHGAAYGLCQIYGNEPWHFELRPKAKRAGCPVFYVDPTHDPRMQ